MNLRSTSMSVNTYEVTILIRAAAARADLEGSLAAVRAVYEAEGIKFTNLEKWDERKLAYPIKGETSALYLIGFFSGDPLAIEKVERRAMLGDVILRQLIISRPGKDLERMREQRIKQAEAAAAAAAANALSEI
jgi:small subunit ribosomal protein S6